MNKHIIFFILSLGVASLMIAPLQASASETEITVNGNTSKAGNGSLAIVFEGKNFPQYDVPMQLNLRVEERSGPEEIIFVSIVGDSEPVVRGSDSIRTISGDATISNSGDIRTIVVLDKSVLEPNKLYGVDASLIHTGDGSIFQFGSFEFTLE